jgi:hypothetical protein
VSWEDTGAAGWRDAAGDKARRDLDWAVLGAGRPVSWGPERWAIMTQTTTRPRRGTSWASVCRMALRLPGVTEGTSYGTPALHVSRRFLARLKEDGETMAIRMDFADRDVLLELDPTVFYLTDHYRPYQAVLVRLKKAPPSVVRRVLEQAWSFQAPKALVARGASAARSSNSPADKKRRGRTTRT